jgi:peptide/nickel transport system substrate-binding protein
MDHDHRGCRLSIGINNYSFWSNPALDDLVERGRTEADVAVRLELYRQAQEIIRAEQPWIFMYHDEWIVATSHDLRGFTVDAARNHNFAVVWFE